jgi:O-antigen/teichoic acid export membrane protein
VPNPTIPVPPPRLGVAVAGSLVAKTLEVATLVLLATLVPRALGPADFGRFSVLLTIVTLGSLALTLGGPTLMARFVPAAPPHERVALARAIGARLTRGRAAQLAAIGLVTFVAAVAIPEHVPPLETVLVFGALALNVGTSLTLQVALGLGITGPWTVRYPLQNAVLIAAVLVLSPLAGSEGAAIAIAVSAAVGTLFAVVVVMPRISGSHPPVAIPPGAIRFGFLQATGAALVQFAQRGGVLAVALLAGSATQAGYAALAIGITLGATYAVLQAFTVSLPHLADHTRVSGGHEMAESILRRLAGGAIALVLPATALAALFLDSLVPAMFGDSYRDATTAFGPALALLVLAPLSALLVQVSALRLRPDAALAGGIGAAVSFVVVALATIPAWGAAGGTAAAFAGGAIGALASLRRLPGAAGPRITSLSFLGAAGVLALSLAS